jgi:glutamate dehydrogenase
VLLATAKVGLYEALLASDVPEDPYLSGELEAYFPSPLPERFAQRMREHRLRREIAATRVVNNMLHGGGTTFIFRVHEETSIGAPDITRAYTVAREVFQMRGHWAGIEALDNVVPAELQTAMLLEGRKLVERGLRWLLRNRRAPLDIAATVDEFASGAARLYDALPRLLSPSDAEPMARRAEELRSHGVPEGLATVVASFDAMFSALDIVEVTGTSGCELDEVAAVHFLLGSLLELHWLRDRIVALPREERWSTLARSALLDDVHSVHRLLTAEVLRSAPVSEDLDARVEVWVAANPAAERCLQTIDEIRVGRVYDLTTLAVAVREVRNLLQASATA